MLNRNTPCLKAEELRQYYEGRADDALRFRIEEHILDCPLCEAALEGYASTGYPGPEQVQRELEQLKMRIMETRDEAPVNMRPSWFNRAAAAAVVLVACMAAWMYWNHTADDRLFAAAFQPNESNVLILRGEEAASPEQARAFQLYQAEAFEEALPHFKNYLSGSPDDFMTMLAAGISAVGARQTAQAIEWLEVVRFNDPALYGEATWYLALAHWGQEGRAQAVELLEELALSKDALWAEKASVFLEKAQ